VEKSPVIELGAFIEIMYDKFKYFVLRIIKSISNRDANDYVERLISELIDHVEYANA
jgi:hypothetical protein